MLVLYLRHALAPQGPAAAPGHDIRTIIVDGAAVAVAVAVAVAAVVVVVVLVMSSSSLSFSLYGSVLFF